MLVIHNIIQRGRADPSTFVQPSEKWKRWIVFPKLKKNAQQADIEMSFQKYDFV